MKNLDSSEEFIFPPIYQYSLIKVRVYVVTPTNNRKPPFYQVVNPGIVQIDLSIGPRKGDEALKAFTPKRDFTKVLPAPANVQIRAYGDWYFTGIINLNTTEMNTAVGVLDAFETFVELRLSEGSFPRATFQRSIKVTSTVKTQTGAAAAAVPVEAHYTKDEMNELIVHWTGNVPGRQLYLNSCGETGERVLGIDDDGQRIDYAYPIV